MSGVRRVMPAWSGPGRAAPPDRAAIRLPAARRRPVHPAGGEELLPGSCPRRLNLFGIVTRAWQNPPRVVREWFCWVMRERRTARSLVSGLAADPLGNGGERGA